MYLQLATDFIRAKKQLKFRDGKYKCSDKRIWQLLWRGFSVDDVYKIVQEQFMYWDIPEYWEEKKLGISGRHFSTCLTLHTYGKGSNRYKDYNYLSAFKTIYGNKC